MQDTRPPGGSHVGMWLRKGKAQTTTQEAVSVSQGPLEIVGEASLGTQQSEKETILDRRGNKEVMGSSLETKPATPHPQDVNSEVKWTLDQKSVLPFIGFREPAIHEFLLTS